MVCRYLVFAVCAVMLLGMVTGASADAYKPWVQILAENGSGTSEWYWDWAGQQASSRYTVGGPYVLDNGAAIKAFGVQLDESAGVKLNYSFAAGQSDTVFHIVVPDYVTSSTVEYTVKLAAAGEVVGSRVCTPPSIPEAGSLVLALTAGLPALGALAIRRRRA